MPNQWRPISEAPKDGKVVISWLMPTEEEIREDVRRMIEGPPVYCYITEYPPLPGERSFAYHARVYAALMCSIYAPRPSLWQRVKAMFLPEPPNIEG